MRAPAQEDVIIAQEKVMLAQEGVVRSPEQGERGKMESWSLCLSAALSRGQR